MLFRRAFYTKYRLNNFSTKLNSNNLDSKLANIASSIKVTESCFYVILHFIILENKRSFKGKPR